MKAVDVLDRLVERLRFHTIRKVMVSAPDGKSELQVFALEDLLRRSRHLVKVGGSAGSKADGWGSTTPGNGSPGSGKGGGKVMSIRDGDTGEVDLVPTSSTEVAAIDGRREIDTVGEQAKEALQCLHMIDVGFERLDRVLVRFERLQNTSAVPDPPMCWVAQVRYKLPFDQEWEPWRTTDFEGVLDEPFDEPRKVSQFVYWFTRRTHRLPEKDEMLEYLRKSTVRVRA